MKRNGVFFFLLNLFLDLFESKCSMNIKYDEIINIYSDRINILVLESLYLSFSFFKYFKLCLKTIPKST